MENIVTLGYNEDQAEGRLESLLSDPGAILVDIRLSPRSRWKPAFNQSSLARRYGQKYLHVPELGNLNYQPENRDKGIVLADPEQGLARVQSLLSSGQTVILLCACKYYDRCHRKTVYDLLNGREQTMRALIPQNTGLTPLEVAGQVANQIASAGLLTEYQQRKSAETIRQQRAAIKLFGEFLQAPGVDFVYKPDMADNLASWQGVTWGLVSGFIAWMVQQEYSVASINARHSTVSTYCKLAARANYIPGSELALIRSIPQYKHSEGINLDESRKQAGLATRKPDTKKAHHTSIAPAAETLLKDQPESKDKLLVFLLIDQGLRVSEISGLNRGSLDLETGLLTFYRKKVKKWQTHELTAGSWQAARDYLQERDPENTLSPDEPLFIGRDGRYATRSINDRVRVLGDRIGLKKLSPHDGRHRWGYKVSKLAGVDLKTFQDAGGWSSPAMPMRYVESNAIANKGIKFE